MGGLAMPRSYEHVMVIEKEIFERKAQGKSNREIREQYGLSKKQLENLINRHNRAEMLLEVGIVPRRRGRLSKGNKPSEMEKDKEIKRLQMENELLRDFLRAAGRK
jgi:transposase